MQKLEFVVLALVVLFMFVAVAGKFKSNVLDRGIELEQEATTIAPLE